MAHEHDWPDHDHGAPQALDRYQPRGDGEITTVLDTRDLSMSDAIYVDMSARPVSDAQASILGRGCDDGDIDIRPDGAIYMSHAKLRKRLNEAFRPGGWALRRLTPIQASKATEEQADRNVEMVVSAEFALYAEGRFLSSARGEQKYQDNGEMTYSDAVEGMKSNALTRCCKDLGIALDLWDRNYADAWRSAHCVKVWVHGKTRPQWRLKTGLPFPRETGIADDSPNRDTYVQPANPRHREPTPTHAQPPRQTQSPQPVQPSREPGEDDEPVQERPRPAAQAPVGNGHDGPRRTGRTISEAQQKRLWTIATREGNLDKNGYRALMQKWGYQSDRDVLMADYDQIVEDARVGTAALSGV